MPAPLSRRTALRGMGAAVALPLLEAMLPARTLRASAAPPKRVAWIYVPNGIHMPDWTPDQEGPGFSLPPLLKPLAEHRRDFSVLSGLTCDKARPNGDGPGDHARACAAFLTGVQPRKDDGAVQLGVSADQMAARLVGGETEFRSLQLGCEPSGNSGQCDSGYACAYSGNLSWEGPSTPAGKDVNPRVAFDRLFLGGGESLQARAQRLHDQRSILDYVSDEARRLRRRLGDEDKQRLSQYLTGVRELERRIARAEKHGGGGPPVGARPKGRPKDLGEHLDLLLDVLLLAFQSDATRIATVLVANEGSNRSYRELGIPEGHHTLSHHGREEEKQRKIARINRFHVERLARFLGRLSEVEEGGQRLLDATMIVYGSAIADGDRHDHHALPILLCGGGNGALRPGQHLSFAKETPLNDLHLRLLHEMGAMVPALGDSSGPLDGV